MISYRIVLVGLSRNEVHLSKSNLQNYPRKILHDQTHPYDTDFSKQILRGMQI